MSPQIIGSGKPARGDMVELPWPIVSVATESALFAPIMVTKSGCFRDARGHWIERAWSEEYVLHYCIGGRGWLRAAGRELPVTTGDIMVSPLGAHAYGASDESPWTVHWIHLRGHQVGPLLLRAGIDDEHPIQQVGMQSELLSHFHRIDDATRAGFDDPHILQAAAQAQLMLAYLILLRRDDRRPEHRVALAVSHMQAHLDEPVTLAELAAAADLSVPHFSRLFRRHFGRSPVDYFLHLKIGVARAQLATTELTVVSIARQLGYGDPYYFSRLFKSFEGCSPSRYRERTRGAGLRARA